MCRVFPHIASKQLWTMHYYEWKKQDSDYWMGPFSFWKEMRKKINGIININYTSTFKCLFFPGPYLSILTMDFPERISYIPFLNPEGLLYHTQTGSRGEEKVICNEFTSLTWGIEVFKMDYIISG